MSAGCVVTVPVDGGLYGSTSRTVVRCRSPQYVHVTQYVDTDASRAANANARACAIRARAAYAH